MTNSDREVGSQTSDPLVSVLIATRNRPAALRDCLASVEGQSYRNIEVVILDDAPSIPDEVPAVVASLGLKPVARIIRSERQLGVAGARNVQMRQARGSILVVIDDDAVFVDKSAIEAIVKFFRAEPTAGILAVKVEEEREGQVRYLVPFSRRERRKAPGLIERRSKVAYYVGTCHAIRSEVVDLCGSYPNDLIYGEEESFYSYKAIASGIDIWYLPEVRVAHRPQRSVVAGRNARRDNELFHHVKNRVWLAWQYLPLPHMVTFLAVWLGFYAMLSIRQMKPMQFVAGLFRGISGLKKRTRSPLDTNALMYAKLHHGRLWY